MTMFLPEVVQPYGCNGMSISKGAGAKLVLTPHTSQAESIACSSNCCQMMFIALYKVSVHPYSTRHTLHIQSRCSLNGSVNCVQLF